MKIDIFTLCHQEEPMIPYFMRHYNQYGQVFIFEGHSTDGSVELAKSLGAIVISIDTNNEVRDDVFTDIKNNCWKSSNADWIMICDIDEFIYHPDMINVLQSNENTIIYPRLFNMFSEQFPVTFGQIYEEVTMGVEGGGKANIFKRSAIKEINYDIGCHGCNPVGDIRLDYNSDIKTLHMRHLSRQYVIDRNKYFLSRMSDVNKNHGWGYHVRTTAEEMNKYFDEQKKKLIKVI